MNYKAPKGELTQMKINKKHQGKIGKLSREYKRHKGVK